MPTLDEKAWRATEPHTPSPAARLDAVAELRRRGIDSGVLIAPLMPGINDTPEQVQPIVDRAREAGATFLGGVALHLRGEVRDVFFGWLEAKRPDLLPKYEQLYAGDRAYMRPEQRARATRAVKGWGRARGSRLRPGELQAGRRQAQPPRGRPDEPLGSEVPAQLPGRPRHRPRSSPSGAIEDAWLRSRLAERPLQRGRTAQSELRTGRDSHAGVFGRAAAARSACREPVASAWPGGASEGPARLADTQSRPAISWTASSASRAAGHAAHSQPSSKVLENRHSRGSLSVRNRRNRAPCRMRPAAAWS